MTLPSSSLSFSPAFSPTDALLGAASSVQANNAALANSNVFGNNLFNTSSVNNLLNTGQGDSQALLQSLIGFVGTNAPTIGTSLGSQNVNTTNLGNTTTLGDTFGLSNNSQALPAQTTSTQALGNIPFTSPQTAAQSSRLLVDPVTGFTFVQTPQSLRTSNGLSQNNNNALAQFMNILPIAAFFSSLLTQQAQPAAIPTLAVPAAVTTPTKSTLVAPTAATPAAKPAPKATPAKSVTAPAKATKPAVTAPAPSKAPASPPPPTIKVTERPDGSQLITTTTTNADGSKSIRTTRVI